MERKPFPSETQERFIVRLPDGMRDRIAAEAKANNRSMNSEIVARLQNTLDQGMPASPDAPTVYLLLDSHGYPLSWEEIRTIWGELVQRQGLHAVKLDATILTPDMESSSVRAADAVALAKRLRSTGKSHVLSKGTKKKT